MFSSKFPLLMYFGISNVTKYAHGFQFRVFQDTKSSWYVTTVHMWHEGKVPDKVFADGLPWILKDNYILAR